MMLLRPIHVLGPFEDPVWCRDRRVTRAELPGRGSQAVVLPGDRGHRAEGRPLDGGEEGALVLVDFWDGTQAAVSSLSMEIWERDCSAP